MATGKLPNYENFYPLTHNKDGSFTEGYWFEDYKYDEKASKLPFPKTTNIPVDLKFLEKLQQILPICNSVGYCGYSLCRLCNKGNGDSEYDLSYHDQHFRFPEGLIHYYTEHNVQPSAEFVKFVMNVDINQVKLDRHKEYVHWRMTCDKSEHMTEEDVEAELKKDNEAKLKAAAERKPNTLVRYDYNSNILAMLSGMGGLTYSTD